MLIGAASLARAAEPCAFDHQQLTFIGTPAQQAHCLVRQVLAYGELGAPLAALPPPLEVLVGQPAQIPLSALQANLAARGIDVREIGGPLVPGVSHAKAGDPAAPMAGYFVIHDTSTPALGNAEFPADIDQPSWEHNHLERWLEGERSRAHIFIARTGASVTPVDFDEPWRATKFEMQDTLLRRKGLFLHVELVQPRRNDPAGPEANEALSPQPGFTNAQYQRLALVYVAASLRRGQWLVPAYHAVLDAGRVDGHDDPQNFRLEDFSQAVASLLEQLRPSAAGPARGAMPGSAGTSQVDARPVPGLAESRTAVAPGRVPE